MLDPPMGVIPCQGLAVMEDQSDGASKPVKFKISAEITEYRGKNYLYPKFVQIVKDLNQGLGDAAEPAAGRLPVRSREPGVLLCAGALRVVPTR